MTLRTHYTVRLPDVDHWVYHTKYRSDAFMVIECKQTNAILTEIVYNTETMKSIKTETLFTVEDGYKVLSKVEYKDGRD